MALSRFLFVEKKHEHCLAAYADDESASPNCKSCGRAGLGESIVSAPLRSGRAGSSKMRLAVLHRFIGNRLWAGPLPKQWIHAARSARICEAPRLGLFRKCSTAKMIGAVDILAYRRARTVRLGSLWIPASEVEKTLARYGRLLFCLNDSSEHPYTLRGSASAIQYYDKCLLFCCKHQFADYDASKVVIAVDETAKTLISGSKMTWRTETPSNSGEEYLDVCAMSFIPENYQLPNLHRSFFPLDDQDSWHGSSDTNFFMYGYPSSMRNVDYDEPHIHVQHVVTNGTLAGASNAERGRVPDKDEPNS
jgi:hypothetical protein